MSYHRRSKGNTVVTDQIYTTYARTNNMQSCRQDSKFHIFMPPSADRMEEAISVAFVRPSIRLSVYRVHSE